MGFAIRMGIEGLCNGSPEWTRGVSPGDRAPIICNVRFILHRAHGGCSALDSEILIVFTWSAIVIIIVTVVTITVSHICLTSRCDVT